MARKLPVRLAVAFLAAVLVIGCGGGAKQNQLAPPKPPTPLELAKESFDQSDYGSAKTQFETVLAADTTNHEAVYYLGRIALQEGDIDGSIGLLDKAVALDEKNSNYHLMLGAAIAQKVQQGSYELAPKILDEFKLAVELDSTNTDARIGLVQYYLNAPPFMGGSQELADEQMSAIIAIDPVKGYGFQAQVHAAKGEFDQMDAAFQSALQAAPDDVDIHYQWGMAHQTAKNYNAAFEKLEAGLKLVPTHMNCLYQIGRTAIFAEDNLERGAECLKLYLKNQPGQGNPSLAHAHWRLGVIYEKMGQPDMAKKEYQAALELNNDLKEAREALEKL